MKPGDKGTAIIDGWAFKTEYSRESPVPGFIVVKWPIAQVRTDRGYTVLAEEKHILRSHFSPDAKEELRDGMVGTVRVSCEIGVDRAGAFAVLDRDFEDDLSTFIPEPKPVMENESSSAPSAADDSAAPALSTPPDPLAT